jgi:tetratricopeptide (TPR) repeat protein
LCIRLSAGAGESDIAKQNPQKVTFDNALTLLQRGDVSAAEELCRDALKSYPEDANILCLSARALIRLHEYDEAENRLNKVLALFPDFPRTHEIIGEMLLAQEKPEQAVDAFERAVHLGIDSAEIDQKLGATLTMLGRTDEAEEVLGRSRRRDPGKAAIAEAKGYERNGDLDRAEKFYRKILLQDPDSADALAGIGAIAIAKQQYADAEIFLQRAVDRAPDFARALADLVSVYMAMEKFDQAVTTAESLLRLDPHGPLPHLMLANACAMSGRHEDALAEYEIVIEMLPGHPSALSGIGHMLKTIGRQPESIAAYKDCIRMNPQHTEAWWGLANMKTYQFGEDEIQEMLKLLQEGEAKAEPTSRWLSGTPEVNLCNALGMAFEKNGDYDRAFEYFERGNKVRRLEESYDPVHTEHLHDRIIDVFSRDFLERNPAVGDGNAEAIFIVGMPRTGSTLIEQILASHSAVDGTHELPELPQLCQRLPVVYHDQSRYPENLRGLEDDAIAAIGGEYIDRTRKYRSGAAFFTDKNPNNFIHVGLLHLILPHARIIDARRHPLDTCLGCYKQLFAKGQSYSYELEELGEYYLQYQRLMDHWDEVLPGKVLHVQYEDVVADLESQVRRILEYCGLPWDDNCLRFFETRRDVRTASSEQVREPIYRSSVSLWRHYERHLGELIEVLGPELLKLPEKDQPAVLRTGNIT